MTPQLTTIRRRVAAKVARLSPAEARAVLDRVRAAGQTIDVPAIRELTGGYCSQSLNHWVTRKLGVQAGMLPKHAA